VHASVHAGAKVCACVRAYACAGEKGVTSMEIGKHMYT